MQLDFIINTVALIDVLNYVHRSGIEHSYIRTIIVYFGSVIPTDHCELNGLHSEGMGYVVSKISASIKKWHSWEDEYAVETMRKRYRGFHRIGFMALDLSEKYAAISIILFCIAGFSLFFITATLLISCFLMLPGDFEDSSGECNLAFLSTLSFSFLINHNYYRKKFLLLHHMLGKGFHDYNEPQYSIDEVKKCQAMLRKQNVALIFLACYVGFISVLIVFICPLIDESLGFGWDVTYDDTGVNRKLPVPLWVPFPSHEGIPFWFSFLVLEGFGGAILTLSIGGTALLFTTLSGGLIIEQKLLVLSIKNTERRAKRWYKLIIGSRKIDREEGGGKKKASYEDPVFQECIGYCLRQNVIHHHAILTYTREYMHFARSPFLFAFCVETIAIAMSMVKLNEGGSKWGANIGFACIAIAELANMVMLCVLGELVTSGSDEINQELYFTKWYHFDIKNKKTLLQLLLETRNSIRLNALGLVICSMEQFSSVMNTAYSFFNLMKVSKSLEEAQSA